MTSLQSPPSEAFEQAKRAQAAAANPAQSAWVEANAGSGKTKVLIDRVARLLLRRPEDGSPGASPSSILCITYTKAAANEMLSRLFGTLGDWSISSDDRLRTKLAGLEGRSDAAYTREDLKQARALFARALETPGGLRIETIHAFCARILRRFPLEAGVSPGFTEIEDDEANSIWQSVVDQHIQTAAVEYPQALLTLSEAAGGLGVSAALTTLKFKREALLAFSRQIQSGADPAATIRSAAGAPQDSPINLITAAMGADLPKAEIIDAVEELNAAPRKATDTKLFVGLCAMLDEPDPAAAFELYLTAIGGKSHDFSPKSNPYTAAVPKGGKVVDLFSRDTRKGDPEGHEITRIKAVYDSLSAAKTAERTLALMQVGLPIVKAYAQQKRLRAALDFDDLIEKTRGLLTTSNAAEWVLYKLDGGLSHLLLDEAQDTSPPQWALINALVEEFQSGLGQGRTPRPRTQFVVGDPKQSIYSFQGANQEHFLAEGQTFLRREEPLAAEENRAVNKPEMAMSFRSTPEVLTFVDKVRELVPLTDAATDLQPPSDANLKPHEARRLNQPGRIELWPLEMPSATQNEETDWTAPTDHIPANAPRRRLAQKIAGSVRSMIDRSETVWKEQPDRSWARQPIAPEDILILVRSRNELFEALIDSLKQENIAVAGADRLRLLDNLGVQDCLNLIRFALQPGDDLVLAEILRGPFCGLIDDNKHLFVLAHDRGTGITLWQSLEQNQDREFSAAKAFCQSILDAAHLPAFDFLTQVLTRRDANDLSGWDKLTQRLGEPVRDPVRALLMGALGHDMASPMSLQAYLAEIEGKDTILKRELGEPQGAVRVMTVHGAKGLQAPIVILPDTTGGTKSTSDAMFFTPAGTPLYSPSSGLDCAATKAMREAANIAAEKESRRLLYVALTRAADRLIIAGAGLGNSKDGFAKSSWYRWCLTAMKNLNPQTLDTDEDIAETLYYGSEPVLLPSQSTKQTTQTKLAPAWLFKSAALPSPPIRLAAPSRLTEDRSTVLKPFGPDRSRALRRGRLIHALLQTLPSVTDADRLKAAQRFLSREPDLTKAEIAEMLDVTLATLQHSAFANIFAKGGRDEAAIVGTLPNGQMVNGRVDRLVITPEEVLIIDYKTDRPAPKDAKDIGEAYLVQMAAYRAVLQALYNDSRPVRCALLYTDGPRLIELDSQEMSESLNRVTSRV